MTSRTSAPWGTAALVAILAIGATSCGPSANAAPETNPERSVTTLIPPVAQTITTTSAPDSTSAPTTIAARPSTVRTVPPSTAAPSRPATKVGTATVTPAATYYANCTAAKAAGAAPLRQGQPGYRSALDRDSDGIACET